MRNECVDRVIDELERYGIRGEVLDRTKHLEIAWDTPVGRRFVIASKTSSDWRASLNIRGHVRRLLKADNMQPKQISELSFQKAMSLPKSVIPIEHILQKDVDALTDMLFDAQTEISNLQDQYAKLLDKFSSMRIVSTLIFDQKASESVPVSMSAKSSLWAVQTKFCSRQVYAVPDNAISVCARFG